MAAPPGPCVILISLSLTTTTKLFFLTDTSITGEPGPFRNFKRKFNFVSNVVLSTTIKKRISCLIVT